MRVIGQVIWLGLCLGAIAGGIALIMYAADAAPSSAHHGQALDGLDGIGGFVSLIAGIGGFILLALGGFGLARRR